MIKLGMIGMGGMGCSHARAIAKMEDVEIVTVCDLIEKKAQAIGEQVGAKWCTDYHDLLDEVDAVWVCTEPFNRRDVVTTAAAAGKDIFTEKPICRQLADADAMLAAAEETGVKYMLGYCLRFWQPYRVLHDTLASGELGDLVNCWTRRYMPWDASSIWYGQQDKSGGVMLDFGSHDIDWLRWLGGDVKTVFGKTFRVRETMHADEHGQVLMLFESGGMGTADDSWSSSLNESSLGVIGTKGAMIVGSDNVVRKKLAGGEQEIVDVEAATDIDPEGRLGKKDEAGEIHAVETRNETIQEHFFRCIREDIEPITPATDGRKTLLTVLALHESARRGASVALAEIG
ncbi:MAG: Gfo/Idh/MocA family oxidoreductase [Planctomycetota bacterium]